MEKVWEERGQTPPAHFLEEVEEAQDEPELDYLENQYLYLFHLASTCRPAAFAGVLPIPHTIMVTIARQEGYQGSEIRTVCGLLREMDGVLLEHWNKS